MGITYSLRGTYVFFQIIGKSLWNLLWLVIPIAGAIVFLVKILGAFCRGSGFAWGLAFSPIIFHAIIAFDKSIVYTGPDGVMNT
jgi:hypothetical protein